MVNSLNPPNFRDIYNQIGHPGVTHLYILTDQRMLLSQYETLKKSMHLCERINIDFKGFSQSKRPYMLLANSCLFSLITIQKQKLLLSTECRKSF